MENKEKAFSIGKIIVLYPYSLNRDPNPGILLKPDPACYRIRIQSGFGSRPKFIMIKFEE
jgi:hypothetical protein